MTQIDGRIFAQIEQVLRIERWSRVIREAAETVHRTKANAVSAVSVTVKAELSEDAEPIMAEARQIAREYQLHEEVTLRGLQITVRFSRQRPEEKESGDSL